MDLRSIENIADAVLYEGYMLYPYRASSVKNRQRFNWGALAPRSYSDAQNGSEAWEMQTECLIECGKNTSIAVKVRFLQLTARQIGRPVGKTAVGTNDVENGLEIVESLEVNGELFQAWHEAVERDIELTPLNIDRDRSSTFPFSFPYRRETEELKGEDGRLCGVVIRTQHEIRGEITVRLSEVASDNGSDLSTVRKVTVLIRNTTPFPVSADTTREEALPGSIVSTHTILAITNGEFISLMDPPERLSAAAAACRNIGTYPVLAGVEGERDCMLSSPIILYDYPKVAAESPGNLFDGTEIDEILTLRIMTLTDDEKREMRSVDDRARKILERTEMLPEEHLRKMHGAIRGLEQGKKAGYG